MSDMLMNTVASSLAKKRVQKLVEDYNDPELTDKGKLETLEMFFTSSFLEGAKAKKDQLNPSGTKIVCVDTDLMDQLVELMYGSDSQKYESASDSDFITKVVNKLKEQTASIIRLTKVNSRKDAALKSIQLSLHSSGTNLARSRKTLLDKIHKTLYGGDQCSGS